MTKKPSNEFKDITLEEFPTWINNYVKELKWKKYDRKMQLNREILFQSFSLGQQFFINNQKPEGNMNYQYDFIDKKMEADDNQVRQAGALWGLALMLQYDQDSSTKGALDKNLKFFFKHTIKGPVKDSLLIAYPGESKCNSGTVALVALGIIEYLFLEQTGHIILDIKYRAKLTDKLNGYLGFLKYMRLKNKHFSDAYSLTSKTKKSKYSPYFDGEIMLCLIKAAKYLRYTSLIPIIEDSAMVMAKDYTISQWRTDPDSDLTKGFFQWSCMAFWEYQNAGWKNSKTFGDYLLCIGWWMIHVHKTLGRVRNTGYAVEGLTHVYRLAKSRGETAAADDLRNTIDQILFKLTSWQVEGPLKSENEFLADSKITDPLAIGGIMNHKQEAPLRVDVVQHQMHAVILALNSIY